MSSSWVYQLVNPWQREAIFWASLIQVCEIDAHSPLTVALFYHDHVCQPVWIEDFPDEINFQQLLYFFSYSFVALWCKYSLLFCCIGLHSGLTLRRCCMIFLSIPGISLCFQAKTSWFALKKEIIFSFSEVGSAVQSSIPSLNLLGRSQLLVVFLMVWEWVLVHWNIVFYQFYQQITNECLLN